MAPLAPASGPRRPQQRSPRLRSEPRRVVCPSPPPPFPGGRRLREPRLAQRLAPAVRVAAGPRRPPGLGGSALPPCLRGGGGPRPLVAAGPLLPPPAAAGRRGARAGGGVIVSRPPSDPAASFRGWASGVPVAEGGRAGGR